MNVPRRYLPVEGYRDADAYVADLLDFVTTSTLLQTLISSIHVLDFFVGKRDLYETKIPQDWREWFAAHDLDTVVDFLLHSDEQALFEQKNEPQSKLPPPNSLLQYLAKIRALSLRRDVETHGPNQQVSRQVGVGMRPKKRHEVESFACYVQKLTADLAEDERSHITHLVDFGAGQGYLGRSLASEPYNRDVIAVESKSDNIQVAKAMDKMVNLSPKNGIRRNKKEYRAKRIASKKAGRDLSPQYRATRVKPDGADTSPAFTATARVDQGVEGQGSIQHVIHHLQDGDL